MIRLHDAHNILGRWMIVATLVFALASATALPLAAQPTGEDNPVATTADPATDDAAMTDTEQAQATDAAAADAPAPKPTVAPVQFGPTGC